MKLGVTIFVMVTILAGILPATSHADMGMHRILSICGITHMRPGDWLMLDIDGTLIVETQTLGRDAWYNHHVAQLAKRENVPEKVIRAREHALNVAIKSQSRVKLTENCLPAMIKELQSYGIWVFSITGRDIDHAPHTETSLKSMDIDFTLSKMPSDLFAAIDWTGFPGKVVFRNNIFYTSGSNKGEVVKWIVKFMATRAFSLLPAHVRFIDDIKKNVVAVDQALKTLGIPGESLEYAAYDPENFEHMMEVAEIELRDFIQRGLVAPIKSDEEAEAEISSAGGMCPLRLLGH